MDKQAQCPCCGQGITVSMPFWLDEEGCVIHVASEFIALTKSEARLVGGMVSAHPRTATINFLAEYIYRDDPECGPLDVVNVVKQYAFHARHKLKHTAVNIEAVWGVGYRFAIREPKGDEDEL